MSSGTDLHVRLAPAKVNLCLDVLGCREDGYHDIRSVVAPISLCDRIRFGDSADGIRTDVELSEELPAATAVGLDSDNNLATRAARLLKDRTGFGGSVHIHLKKNIPVGGGLGGGSADAAAVLVGLNDLWGTGLSRSALAELGSELGCDIPALVLGGIVVAEGLGEKVRPAPACGGRPAEPWWLVLANPGINVSTRDIYARWKPPLTSSEKHVNNMLSALEEGDVVRGAAALHNGLQETVFRKYPLIQLLAEGLMSAGSLGTLVAGSGASVFGLARDREDAARIETGLGQCLGFPVWTRVVSLLPDGVMAAHGPLEARV